MEQKVITDAEFRGIHWQFDRLGERICRADVAVSVAQTTQETIVCKPLAVVESWGNDYQKLFFVDKSSTLLDVCSNKYINQQMMPDDNT